MSVGVLLASEGAEDTAESGAGVAARRDGGGEGEAALQPSVAGLQPWSHTRANPGRIRRVQRRLEPSLPLDEQRLAERKTAAMRSSKQQKRSLSTTDVPSEPEPQPESHTSSGHVAMSLSVDDTERVRAATLDPEVSRLNRFHKLLTSPNSDLDSLKKLSWSGIPAVVRAQAWKILLGYVPTNKDRRDATLQRKRQEYLDFLPQYYKVKTGEVEDKYESGIFHQIHIDVPRTNPMSSLFQQELVQDSLERILFLWAIRHPASGYVQGINDLATPFFVVFLSEYIEGDPEACNLADVAKEDLDRVEADCFWCMTNLLHHIQENYTFAQPGIQKMIFKLRELVGKIDSPLAKHLDEQEADYVHFAFRWMNCLLMREMPLSLVVRIWDTYLSEAEDFPTFHVYVCATFLAHWSEKLLQLEFQDIMLFLQHLPTPKWTQKEVDLLLSQAFLYKSLYHDAPSHLR